MPDRRKRKFQYITCGGHLQTVFAEGVRFEPGFVVFYDGGFMEEKFIVLASRAENTNNLMEVDEEEDNHD